MTAAWRTCSKLPCSTCTVRSICSSQQPSFRSSSASEQIKHLEGGVFLRRYPCKVLKIGRRRVPLRGTRAICALSDAQHCQVVLTRERGKNGKLMIALQQQGISVLEMPLVETMPGPDRDQLPIALQEGGFDWVVITSPEAAAVFLRGWESAGRPQVRLAVVGAGTGKVFEETAEPAISVTFTPSKANADHLSSELPLEQGRSVLYPASAKAGSTLQEGLEQRGFTVRRLNTYNTVPVQDLSPAAIEAAREASVAAFASPSAIKSWVALVGGQDTADVAIACIGSTTAEAAEKQGLQKVYFPDAPGLDGFVDAIVRALEQNDRSRVLSAV